MKKVKPRVSRTELVPVRRSPRVAKSAAPEFREVFLVTLSDEIVAKFTLFLQYFVFDLLEGL